MDIYERIFRKSSDGIFTMNKKRFVTSCNEALCKMFEYSEREIIGKSASIFHISKESYESYGRKIAKAVDKKTSFVIEWNVMKKDGAVFPTEVTCTPFTNEKGFIEGYISIVRDITIRKNTEKALRESEEKYRELSDSLPITIFETDRLGNITYVNDSGFKTFGYSREEVLVNGNFMGMNALQIISPQERDSAIDNMQIVLLVGSKVKVERNCVRKDGAIFPAIIKATPIISDGNILGIRGILLDITERKTAEEKIRHIALHDPLTGLPNRILLKDRFNMAFESAKRNKKMVGYLFLDLDDFKKVNDSFGHDAGDLLLKGVAERVQKSLRKVDTLARIGGDEFVVILPEIGKIDTAKMIAERILKNLKNPFHIDGKNLHAKVSIGVSLFPKDGCDSNSLHRKADAAMYKAKTEGGKNSFRVYKE